MIRQKGANDPGAWVLGLLAFALAAFSALPYAGGWNDGSRLAAVESLLDRHTLAIDDSIFCRPPPDTIRRGCPPYPLGNPDLLEHGTRDKLVIAGHFYSDKPAVITCLMAGVYQIGMWLGLPGPAQRPDIFCWILTVGTAGFSYALAVMCLYQLGGLLGLPGPTRLIWIASFALSTVALTYTEHANSHIWLLGVVAVSTLETVRLWQDTTAGQTPSRRLVLLGTLAGLAYNLDLGAGPLFFVGLLGLTAYRCRRVLPVLVFLLAVTPWLVGCHAFNYAIGGVWKPINMVPEYSTWPGCPFNADNLTGFARHGPLKLPVYLLAMLFGKHGFVTHNVPLFLLLPAVATCVRRGFRERMEVALLLGWCLKTWLLYGVLSNNYGGASCSIRWFVPFLAPCYFLLAVHLREFPHHRKDFLVLSLWGGALSGALWWAGPWAVHICPFLWPVVGAALVSWLLCHLHRRADAVEPADAAIVPLAA